MYFRRNLGYESLGHFKLMNNHNECLVAKVESVIIVAIYRPPSGNVFEFLEVFDNLLVFLGSCSLPFFYS